MKKHFILVALFLMSILAVAQEESNVPAMVTDRPDATESPLTVPKGFLQIEAGGFYESFEENSFKTEVYGYNTTLLRYGVLDNLELRLGWNFEETRFSFNGNETNNILSGFSPLLAGMKVEIADENGWLPQIGLLGHLYLPLLAASDYRPETTGVDFRFSFSHTLSSTSSLAYNLGAQWLGDSPEAAYVYTLVYGYSVSEKLGLYAEVYGDLPEDSRSNHLWNTGFTYLIKPNFQLDATVGRSFTKGQDILLSLGATIRIPK
ncbi:transporter [Jejudonia soesokkakensis]|uniref:Transporter n=1 Tax=Jejudonia soesokkakensis TaxID=1323432 RepID=A0ABW2MRT7_9FLAO